MLIIGIILTICVLASLVILLLQGSKAEDLNKKLEKIERNLREESAQNREESGRNSKELREEILNQLVKITNINEAKLDKMRGTIEERLKSLQDDNSQKLEKMRETVDERLHATLEKRLGESFKLVSDRLELVHKGLGEMQVLATGVSDLKKVFTNIKARGTWGEVQLGSLLDEILTPEQYATNVATKKGSRENVEYAIKLPGKDGNIMWLPLDAKFPTEDYERLVQAQEQADPGLAAELGKALENKIKSEAKNIKDKYLAPPDTTDFGIMFLPTEGLFAEILRRPGLFESIRRECKVIITGPTTITAILHSLQMGFRTLAIEKRAGEVWNLLEVIKREFGNFGALLDKTHEQLQAASNTLESATKKTKTIEKKLQDVQSLPNTEPVDLVIESESELKENSSV